MANFSVNNFMAELSKGGGGARQNQFEVAMTFPAAVPSAVTSNFNFMCKAASLPAEELGTITIPYFGRQLKVPGDRTFADWTVTIINDETFAIRNAFEMWSNALNGHLNNARDPGMTTLTGPSGQLGVATITQYSKGGDVIQIYVMQGVWPVNVSAIDMAWDHNDAIEDFQVNLAYQWWESQGVTA